MRVVQFDVRDNQLLIERSQSRKRPTISRLGFPEDRPFVRRRRRVGQVTRQRFGYAAPPNPPVFIDDAILRRLPEVRAERAARPGLEVVQASERVQHRVLDDVSRVDGGAGPTRQAPMRPLGETRKVARNEPGQRVAVSPARMREQACGRVVWRHAMRCEIG